MKIWQGKVPIKAWADNVHVENDAVSQLKTLSQLPFIFKHIAVMPDVHTGMGATIGSVVPTQGAVIPSAVGVDIGCGMNCVKTSLTETDIPPEKRSYLRQKIESVVPVGRTNNGGKGDKGAWGEIPKQVLNIWRTHLESEFKDILHKNPGIQSKHLNSVNHLGTLGGGNHFIEVCLDLDKNVWLMLHSGSRGVGNRIGQYFINKAKEVCCNGSSKQIETLNNKLKEFFKSKEFKDLDKNERKRVSSEKKREIADEKKRLKTSLPHRDLAYLEEGSELFSNYMQAVLWAQKFAKFNRSLMLERATEALENVCGKFSTEEEISCHHNYVDYEEHFGEKILVTRKGAISAQKGQYGIIPGSMGAKSYIVEGLGNVDSFCSASHGAGRKMSRSAAKKQFTVEDHQKATEGIECSKDESVLDETPLAYKDIDIVMKAELDLVKPVYQLRQIICIKGGNG